MPCNTSITLGFWKVMHNNTISCNAKFVTLHSISITLKTCSNKILLHYLNSLVKENDVCAVWNVYFIIVKKAIIWPQTNELLTQNEDKGT